MLAPLLALVGIGKWLVSRLTSLAGSIAIIIAFGGIASMLLLVRTQIYNMVEVFFSSRLIAAASAGGLWVSIDIIFASLGSALAVRLTRIIAARLAKAIE